MGASMVLPEANSRMRRVIKSFYLSNSDISKFFKAFNRIDKTRIGKISLAEIFKGYEINNWELVANQLMMLVDVDLDPAEPNCIDFADFCLSLLTFCCFEPPQMLRFCMFMYDPEKNGHIEIDDLKSLMNTLHGIVAPDTVLGNEKKSWHSIGFPVSGKIEYDDLVEIHTKTPLILKPIFRLQEQICEKFLGEGYWDFKKRDIYEAKLRADRMIEKKKEKKERKKNAQRDKKIKKKMGLLRYYLCPCIRYLYDPEDITHLSDDELKARERLKRLQELAAKNPETTAWKKYKKKLDNKQGNGDDYIVEKHLKTERHREARAMGRARRQQERKEDEALQTFVG